jgi:hypothetical protein
MLEIKEDGSAQSAIVPSSRRQEGSLSEMPLFVERRIQVSMNNEATSFG